QWATIADRIPSRARALVLVAAFSRLRWEELVGLRRKRIDLEAGTVTVDEQLVEVNGTFSVGAPKRAAGRPPEAMHRLGHATTVAAVRYRHVRPTEHRRVLAVLAFLRA